VPPFVGPLPGLLLVCKPTALPLEFPLLPGMTTPSSSTVNCELPLLPLDVIEVPVLEPELLLLPLLLLLLLELELLFELELLEELVLEGLGGITILVVVVVVEELVVEVGVEPLLPLALLLAVGVAAAAPFTTVFV